MGMHLCEFVYRIFYFCSKVCIDYSRWNSNLWSVGGDFVACDSGVMHDE